MPALAKKATGFLLAKKTLVRDGIDHDGLARLDGQRRRQVSGEPQTTVSGLEASVASTVGAGCAAAEQAREIRRLVATSELAVGDLVPSPSVLSKYTARKNACW